MPTPANRIYAVILAAGVSSRMGSPKQILDWQGKTLLEHAVLTAQTVMPDSVFVVLGANADAIRAKVNLHNATLIINPDWQEGMAASIRTAVNHLPADAAGLLLLLCDQPLINAGHVQQLLQTWQAQPDSIVASAYRQTLGVPALFPAWSFPQLLQLSGDRGAKVLFSNVKNRVLTIPLPEAEIDVDCLEDYARFRQA
jgi:molybdenum cofactor cytidylyltransferase